MPAEKPMIVVGFRFGGLAAGETSLGSASLRRRLRAHGRRVLLFCKKPGGAGEYTCGVGTPTRVRDGSPAVARNAPACFPHTDPKEVIIAGARNNLLR